LLSEDGSLLCWGLFELQEPEPYVQLAAGVASGRICALRTDGEVDCFARGD